MNILTKYFNLHIYVKSYVHVHVQQFLKELDVKKSNAENFIFTNYKPVIS